MDREYWSGSDLTFQCLIDEKRTMHFKKVIQKIVKSGDIVVDLGSGTGILTMFAVESDAELVYPVEADSNLWTILEKNFELNHFCNKIKLLKNDACNVKLPKKVDVIICEMIATGLIDEIQIPAMNNALKYLKKGGKIIPSKFLNFVELVYNNNIFYGNKFNIVRYEYSFGSNLKSESFTEKKLYKEVDFYKHNNLKIDVELTLKINKEGMINGLRISNETIFPDDSSLEGTDAYATPMILPIKEQKVKQGNIFSLKLSYDMCKGLKTLNYSVKRL